MVSVGVFVDESLLPPQPVEFLLAQKAADRRRQGQTENRLQTGLYDIYAPEAWIRKKWENGCPGPFGEITWASTIETVTPEASPW